MRKILPAILVLLVTALDRVHAQMPVIKVTQYTILIERTITHRTEDQCFHYVNSGGTSNNCYTVLGAIISGPGTFPPVQNNRIGWCNEPDPNCNCGPTSLGGDKLSFKMFDQNNSLLPSAIQDINISTMPKGTSLTYYDTVRLVQGQFNISRLESRILYADVDLYQAYYTDPSFTTGCNIKTATGYIYPFGEYFDQLNSFSTPFPGKRYNLNTRIRVLPNLEPSYTLPSHDKIQITQTGNIALPPTWQYMDTVTNSWHDISPALTSGNGNVLNVSGFDIFGTNYVNYLHSTVNFRVRSANNIFSAATPFTLRLSSPHISSVAPTHLNCFEKNEGSLKIQFDRALLPGEKLNILLLDTVDQVNYSALNLDELAADNSYTWPNELRAGIYHVTLLGKYAKGILNDLYVDTRVDTVSQYIALNSINFEDGFNTPESPTDFNAFTDYTGYAQATYTGSLAHLAFLTLTQPTKILFAARVDTNISCKGAAAGVITLAAGGGKHNYKYSLKHGDSTSWSAWVNFDNNNVGTVFMPNPFFFTSEGTTTKVRNLYAGKYLVRVRDEVDCFARDSSGNEVTYSYAITEPEKGITIDLLEISPITSADSANGQIKVHISGGTPFINGEISHDPYDVAWIDSATNTPVSYTNTILEANKRMKSQTGNNLADGAYYLRIKDAYYSQSLGNTTGCFLEIKIPVRKPEPLFVNIEANKQIRCFDSADAKLLAKAGGGIPIDSLRYNFKWYHITAGGNLLLPETDSLLENVGPGNYLVEITDKYNNHKTSQAFTLTQPQQMQLTMSATQATCYTLNNGNMSVSVTGGTPFVNGSYTYEWSTGDRTPSVDSVSGGNYLLIVTDSMFCIAKDTVSVNSPVRVIPNVVTQPVSCKGACDGQIAVTATGGTGIYTWLWNTGATTSTISDLCAGTYWYTVTDAGGCSESDTIILGQPDTLFVNLGADRKICIGQAIRLDATASDTAVLTYNWQSSNGFTANTAKVAITQPGTYRVAVSSNSGCVVRDTIIVTGVDSVINTDFVVSTQAFVNESVKLVNISKPFTDSVKWLVPPIGNTIRINNQNNTACELIFSDTGRFSVTMRAFYRSGCIEDTTKIINVITHGGQVITGNQANAYLKAYAVIYPNPNNGTFKVDLKFSEMTRARLRLINTLTNITVNDRLIQGDDEYLLDYNMGLLSNGIYILVIDAAKGSFVFKVIIAQ